MQLRAHGQPALLDGTRLGRGASAGARRRGRPARRQRGRTQRDGHASGHMLVGGRAISRGPHRMHSTWPHCPQALASSCWRRRSPLAAACEAGVTRLEITRREVVLQRPGLRRRRPLREARRHACISPSTRGRRATTASWTWRSRRATRRGWWSSRADFYLLKPVDPARGNGRLFYEAGNRGTKRILPVFQGGAGADDPDDRRRLRQRRADARRASRCCGWDGSGTCRPAACAWPSRLPPTAASRSPGWCAATSSPAPTPPSPPVADRGHEAYPVVDPDERSAARALRAHAAERRAARSCRAPAGASPAPAPSRSTAASRPAASTTSSTAPAIRAWSASGLAGTRDLVSFFKHATAAEGNPSPGLRHAIGWGVSQTGRFLRHFVYQGFNEDEQRPDRLRRRVRSGGRRRPRLLQPPLRPAVARPAAALQHPVPGGHVPVHRRGPDRSGHRASPTACSRGRGASNTVPKMLHLLTNSEVLQPRRLARAHRRHRHARRRRRPTTSRIYMVASAPHIVGAFPPAPFGDKDFVGQADMNPLVYTPVIRALFRALDALGRRRRRAAAEPLSHARRRHAGGARRGRLAGRARASTLPPAPMTTYRLDFGPDWAKGIVTNEPPGLGAPFVSRVPAVDDAGNDRGGIRLPADRGAARHPQRLELPPAVDWRARSPGQRDRIVPAAAAHRAPTARARATAGASIAERYASREDYLGRIAAGRTDAGRRALPAGRGRARRDRAAPPRTGTGRRAARGQVTGALGGTRGSGARGSGRHVARPRTAHTVSGVHRRAARRCAA